MFLQQPTHDGPPMDLGSTFVTHHRHSFHEGMLPAMCVPQTPFCQGKVEIHKIYHSKLRTAAKSQFVSLRKSDISQLSC